MRRKISRRTQARAANINTKKRLRLEPQYVLHNHQAQRAVDALPGSVAKNHARVSGIELLVDLEPPCDGYPRQQRQAKNQRHLLRSEKEDMFQVQDGACAIGQSKRQGDQQDIRYSKQNTGFTWPTEHPASA